MEIIEKELIKDILRDFQTNMGCGILALDVGSPYLTNKSSIRDVNYWCIEVRNFNINMTDSTNELWLWAWNHKIKYSLDNHSHIMIRHISDPQCFENILNHIKREN